MGPSVRFVGTREERRKPGFDWVSMAAWLDLHIAGWVENMSRCGVGSSSL